MPTQTAYHAGDLVDLYDEGEIVCAVVTGEEKNRLKVTTESGKEMRVVASRVAQKVAAGFGGRDPMTMARDHARATRARLEAIDAAALWDVLVDEPRRYTLEEMAALALGEPSPVARSATLRKLASDRLHFVRKGDDYEPRSREQVEEALKREAAERARAERRANFVRAAREALAGERFEPLDRRVHGETIADMVELAIMGDEAPARAGALEIIDEAAVPAGASSERAFALLLALQVFTRDENLFIHRFNLRTTFPPEVLEAAVAAKSRAESQVGRIDLRSLDVFTIDDESTTEMDDAISIEPLEEGRWRVGIHIADPASFVLPGDPVDVEALKRAATFYFPDVKLPMMPPAIAEEAASLVAGQARPALSFLINLSPQGEILEQTIVLSTIRSIARLTYQAADALLEGERPDEATGLDGSAARAAVALRLLRPICEALEARRFEDGAIHIRAPEISLVVEPDGKVIIRRVEDRGLSRRMVAEMMILANRVAAEFCVTRALPAIYRRQPPPLPAPGPAIAAAGAGDDASVPDGGEEPAYDPVAVKALRRRMRRGEVGLTPDRHHGLGLAAYTQATSPIRRYQDLAMHRQIQAALAGLPPVYSAEDLARIAATTEEAERAAREAERGTYDYWILRHYETRVGDEVEGVIVAVDPRRTEIELSDTLYTVFLPARPDHRPGARVRLTIEAVRPRARRLTLRESLP